MQTFAEWLQSIGLERHIEVLTSNGVAFDVLHAVTEVDLGGILTPF